MAVATREQCVRCGKGLRCTQPKRGAHDPETCAHSYDSIPVFELGPALYACGDCWNAEYRDRFPGAPGCWFWTLAAGRISCSGCGWTIQQGDTYSTVHLADSTYCIVCKPVPAKE